MVNLHVNLLKNRPTLSEKDYRREQTIFRLTVLSLVVVVFVTAALSIWNFLLSRKLGTIESSITKTSGEMKGLAEANAQQVYLKSRLKLISSFLDERSVSRESMQRVFSLAIPGATISAMSFISETVIGVQVVAQNIQTLNEVVTYYQTDSSFFSQVVSRGISRGKGGTYQLELEFTIPKGGA